MCVEDGAGVQARSLTPAMAPLQAATSIVVLALVSAGAARSASTEIHVDGRARGVGAAADGTAERPFATLDDAKHFIIATAVAAGALDPRGGALRGAPATVKIAAGRYAPLLLDHPALSGSRWEGVPDSGGALPVISGGIDVPASRFEADPKRPGVYVAPLSDLNISDLGRMMSGNGVADCQHDKVGVAFDGTPLTLARWPNVNASSLEDGGWEWAHAWVYDEPSAGQ